MVLRVKLLSSHKRMRMCNVQSTAFVMQTGTHVLLGSTGDSSTTPRMRGSSLSIR